MAINIQDIKKLRNKDDFEVWKRQLDIYLNVEGLMDVINEEDATDSSDSDYDCEIDNDTDYKAQQAIVMTINDKLYPLIRDCTQARKMYNRLVTIFQSDDDKLEISDELEKVWQDYTYEEDLDAIRNIGKFQSLMLKLTSHNDDDDFEGSTSDQEENLSDHEGGQQRFLIRDTEAFRKFLKILPDVFQRTKNLKYNHDGGVDNLSIAYASLLKEEEYFKKLKLIAPALPSREENLKNQPKTKTNQEKVGISQNTTPNDSETAKKSVLDPCQICFHETKDCQLLIKALSAMKVKIQHKIESGNEDKPEGADSLLADKSVSITGSMESLELVSLESIML